MPLHLYSRSIHISVQVHPSDQQPNYLPEGEGGKTEAWVVLETGPKGRIFAGLAARIRESRSLNRFNIT